MVEEMKERLEAELFGYLDQLAESREEQAAASEKDQEPETPATPE